MKRCLTICGTIVIFIIISVRIIYSKYTTQIRIDEENVYNVAIMLPNEDIDIDIKDKDKIKKIIKYVNSINYYKGKKFNIYNQSPDSRITLFDAKGKIIDRIDYYGSTAVYKNFRYGIFPFTYDKLGEMCKNLN